MYCKSCGEKLKTRSLFCSKCGHKASPKKSVKKVLPDTTPNTSTYVIVGVIIIILCAGIFSLVFYQNKINSLQEQMKTEQINAQTKLDQAKNEQANTQAKLVQSKKDKAAADVLAQAKIAKAQKEKAAADALAQQEEAAKKKVEEELAQKELQDTLLAQDLDGDGLTLREEQELGTNSNDADSDNDGIKDGEDTNPLGGGQNIPKVYEWSHSGNTYQSTFVIHSDWYDYYKNQERIIPFSTEYATPNDLTIKAIANQLLDIKKQLGESCSSCIALDFVQSLPYINDSWTGYYEYPKYPVQTLVEENGDCEDTSYLLASIIRAMGVGAVIIDLPGHRAVGARCDWKDGGQVTYKGATYCYIETTGDNWEVGKIPSEYQGVPVKIYPIS